MLEEKTQDLMVNMQAVLPLIVTNALNALGAIAILLIGLWLSGRADRLVVKVLSRTPHFDPTLKSFFGSLARYLILTVTLLAVLSQFGIHTTSLVAILGAASLAVGLALQGTLSNLAAGVMLLIFRPFRVKELSLFWTELVTDDKVQILMPNGAVWGQPLHNFSIYPAPPHAGEVRFRVADGAELEPAIEKVRTIVEAHPHVLDAPAPTVLLDRSAATNTIELVVTFSTNEGETAAVKSDLIKAALNALDTERGKPAAVVGGVEAPAATVSPE